MNEKNTRKNIHRIPWLWGILFASAVFTLCFAAGYGLSLLLFGFTGRPPEIWAFIITGILALGVFTLCMKIIASSSRRRLRDKRWTDMRSKPLKDTIEAIERIAHGDFSVFIPVEKYNPFSEIAESVNKMARELGSMENLRQNFISDVSHEIQSPLTSISGFAALLKNERLTPQQRAHYIDVIETEARRLSKLSDNLLRLSSLEVSEEPLKITSFSLDKQIQNAALVLEPQWSAKNIDLSLALDKTAYNGDEGLLNQVWINLLHNAVKFTPQGGKIDVTLTRGENEAICHIADTGIGISEEDRMRVFERFYKADKARDRALGGSGLGLSLVKKIVELHGGTVGVESRPGEGSTFSVTLPFKR